MFSLLFPNNLRFCVLFYTSNDVINILDALFFHKLPHSINHLDRCIWIMEVRRTNGYHRCPCHHEFNGILIITDTTHTDDRKIHCIGNLIYHTDCNRLNGRT